MCLGNLIPISNKNTWFSLPYIRTELLSLRVQHVCWNLIPISDQNMWFSLPYIRTELLSLRVQHVCWNLIPISDQNMWFSLPYIRTELLSLRVQHVSWEPYSYFRPKYVIFPTLYQNWTAVLEGPACVLKTLSLFQIKICHFTYPISELNCCPRGSSMCPENLIPISDQNMWFSLPYITTELLSSRVQHVSWEPYSYFRSKYVIFSTLYHNWTAVLESLACVLTTLSLFQIKICDFLYPISQLNCCPRESSMCPDNLIPISDQNMWFSLPYITTELLSSRV